jgi:hypothetical protein
MSDTGYKELCLLYDELANAGVCFGIPITRPP